MEEVKGKHALLRFDGKKCIHSRQCVLGRPDVFVPNVEGEWIHPDNATLAEIAALALACPSGAITYEPLGGEKGESAPLVNLVRVRENGPLALHGELSIDGAPVYRATLCRCGQSANKPYCDGAHASSGFIASGEPLTKDSTPLSKRNGSLKVIAAKDGPLLLEGSAELCTGTGRTINRTEKTALCRCGQSANKPYCDGSHIKAGFRS